MTWGAIGSSAVGVIGTSLLSDKGGSSPSASSMPSMTPEQQAALAQLLQKLTGRDSATTPYGRQLSASMTPGQDRSLAALEELSMNSVRDMGRAKDTLNSAMSDTGADTTDLFTKSVENPARRSFELNTMPDIGRRFKGNAIFGDDARLAERNAANDLERNLAGSRSQMVYAAQQAAKDRALKAAGMLPGMDQASVDILGKLFAAQLLPQQTQQSALDRLYQEFVRGQTGEQTNVSQILAALGLQPLNTVVTPGQPGFGTAAAPGIGSAFTQYALNRWLRPNSTALDNSSNGTDASGYPFSDTGDIG